MVKLFCAIVGVGGSVFSVRVDEDDSVDDLKDAIKAKKPDTIKAEADKLQLFLAKKDEGRGAWVTEEEAMSGVGDTTDLKLLGAARARLRRVGLSDKDVGGVDEEEEAEGRGPVNVLVVVPDLQQAASIKKQLRYKGMSTEASCRKFLDALAQKLAMLYDFECSYGGVPTIGDVFNAVRTKDWGFRLKRGKQLTDVELPEYFTEDEWNDLKDLNLRTNRRIHDGKVPTTSKGKSYIILPHVLFTDGRVDRYKGIATKASMVWEPTEFEVKDEDEFSGSSRSSSGRSDGA